MFASLKYLLPLLLLPALTAAQFLGETFDTDLTSGGFTTPGAFVYAPDGTAAQTADWRNRSRLRSASEGGAALFPGGADVGQLFSPPFDAAGAELYLTFYHYLRTEGGTVRVSVLGNNGVPLFSTVVVPNLGAGEETSAGKFEIIDISAVLTQPQAYQLEFSVEGEVSFWLIDDITVTETRPNYPTFPRYLGEQLTGFGVPFVTDSTGAAAVPFELVIDFSDTATPADRQSIRQQIGAVQKQTCVCDRLEVWELPGGTFFDPVSGQPLGDPGDILERVVGSGPSGNVDGVELNLLNYNELQNKPPVANPPLTADDIAALPPAPDGAVRIAVLDTGLDLDHPDLAGYVFRNDDPLGDGNDDDANCYPDDAVGWNFVDNNNNPSDDHSHGTHVAGIVARQLARCQTCPFQIIPYKTHNSYGVGTLFAASCATYQAAINDGASVINASWGFYGQGSDILAAAIDTAGNYGALVTAAAGNDSLNLVADDQYPATLTLPTVVSVGSVDDPAAPTDRAAFSNYNPALVDVFAPGVSILSSVPNDATAVKSGTSMAAPAVAAAAALYVCDNGPNPTAARSFLLTTAAKFPVVLGAFVLDGNLLSFGELCNETADTGGQVFGADYNACFVGELLSLKALRNTYLAEVEIYFQNGGLVARRTNVNLATGETLGIDLRGQPAGDYLLAIRRGERVFVERLAKR